jgi:hypothetical protein
MAINFPNSPATNSTYTVGSTTWSFDGEKWILVASAVALDDLSDVETGLAENGDFLKFNGTSWVSASIPAGTVINALDDIGDVSVPSPTAGQILVYNGSAWVNQDNTAALLDIDGGTSFEEIFEAELTNMVEAVYDGGVF